MSILNGNISANAIYPENQDLGSTMVPVAEIPEPSVACALLGEDILICGGERIALYRISESGSYTFLSALGICGKARQIAVKNGYAYVTSRENGIYVCDLTNPENPKLVYNIDTIELATGIAVAENILAVVNRHMGCELFDITEPEKPERIAHFMCGEAQSVCLYGKYAVIGDWMNKRARIFDISDTQSIKEMSQMYVDGFADGVCTFEKDDKLYCAVATGHHSARLKNRRKYENYTYVTPVMLAEGYGCGHGVEIFDVTNPQMPEWVCAIKTPPLFGGLDTWLVFTDGESIVFTDSMNGVFVISVNDIANPKITNSFKLPPIKNQKVSPPSIQIQTGAVTGAALVNGFLCAASEQNGIQLLKPDTPLMPFNVQKLDTVPKAHKSGNENFFTSKGQIHSFVQYKDKIYCACGNVGIEVIDTFGNPIAQKATKGICRDIILYDDMLICAESDCGFAVYDTDSLSERYRFSKEKTSVRQIIKTQKGIAAVKGFSEILFFDRDVEYGFTPVAEHRIPGILYHRHSAPCTDGNSIIVNPLSVGPTVLYENEGKVSVNNIFDTQFCPFSDGACCFDGKLITVYCGNYFASTAPYAKAEGKKIPGALLDGQPFAVGSSLVLLNRYNGNTEIFDLSDFENPLLIKQVKLDTNPEYCGIINGSLFAACGFGGIIKL